MTLAADMRLAAARCSSCPKMCRGVCPTLEVTRNERHQPWGHAHEAMAAQRSAEAGGAGFATPGLAGAAYACATCGACTVPCEVEGVETPVLTWAVRAAIWEAGAAPEMARRAVTEAAGGRVLVAEDPPRWERPDAALVAIREAADGGTVVLVAGCEVLGRRPGAAVAAVRALRALGVGVMPPAATHRCCGAVARAMGDAAGAAELARVVLDEAAAAGASEIAVQSPACAQHLVDMRPGGDGPAVLPLASLLARVSSAGEGDGEGDGGLGCGREVLLHHSCFLARHLAVTEEPQVALRSAGYTVEQLTEPAATPCGGRGGGLELTHPSIAAGYLDRLVGAVRRRGGRPVVSGCAACAAALAVVAPDIAVSELAEAVAAGVAR